MKVTLPLERLRYFQDKLELGGPDMAALEPHRELFTRLSRDFGSHFWDYFWAIDRTRPVLEHDRERRLEKVLGHWYLRLFTGGLDQELMGYLWSSGVKHVQANLDQRYINLGYAMARNFTRDALERELGDRDERLKVAQAVDRLLDFCVLVATDSYLSVTSRCDRQVIEGIAHQVRNPVTVIGGSIRRLLRQAGEDQHAQQAYEMVLEENQRLERMVRDVSEYTRMFHTEAEPLPVDLGQLVCASLDDLRSDGVGRGVDVEVTGTAPDALADPQDAAVMVRHILANALEGAGQDDPRVAVSLRDLPADDRAELEVFNTGKPLPADELEELMNPFHSTKPMGTGFGLPIAMMAARRNLGSMVIEPAPAGTRCLVRLPRARAGDQGE